MAHAGVAPCQRMTQTDLASFSLRISTTTVRPAAQSQLHRNYQGSTVTRRRSGEGQERGGVLCTDPASAAAAAAAASAAASKRNALLQASKHCLLLHGAASDAAASARTIGAMVLIFAATTPYSSRLNLALVVAVELRLRCWPGGYGDTKTTGCQSQFGPREFGTKELSKV